MAELTTHPSSRAVKAGKSVPPPAKLSSTLTAPRTARATALKEVPNGTVKSSELEKEHGKLIYSYDITVPGKSGVEEVNVNAVDGSVVGKMHESAKTEKKEATQASKTTKKTTK
jgi:uncharacterized membrane protein YkoI